MIRSLRKTHRGIASLLALALPLVLVTALRSRNPLPAEDPLPDSLLGGELPEGTQLAASAHAAPAAVLRSRLYSVDAAPGRLAVEVELTPPETAPGALLYWVPGGPRRQGWLPPKSLLLGRLEAPWRPRFILPPGAHSGGSLLVYSLAHQRVVASARLERRAAPGGESQQ